jgi:hypothetical protein
MELLDIGTGELLFIIVIALIVIKPKDWQKTGRLVGEWLNKVSESENWQSLVKITKELGHLPTQLRRDAYYEKHIAEESKEPPEKNGKQDTVREKKDLGTWLGPEHRSEPEEENSILPSRSVTYPPAAPKTMKASKKRAPSKKPSPAKNSGKTRTSKSSTREAGKKSNA